VFTVATLWLTGGASSNNSSSSSSSTSNSSSGNSSTATGPPRRITPSYLGRSQAEQAALAKMTVDMAKTSPMRLEPSLHESADTTADPVDYEDAYRPLQHIEKPDGSIEIIYEDEFEKEALEDMLSVDSTLSVDDFIKADPEIPVSSPVPKWARQVYYFLYT
jgi:hypothetical protein